MPMYLPLVALAFFVQPLAAITTAIVTPLLSGAVTGMPPFYPPIAPCMSMELGAMAAIIAFTARAFPRVSPLIVLIPVLLFGRALFVALVYGWSLLIDLPAELMAGLSFVTGWPGIVLMLIVVPAVVRVKRISKHPK
jgi:hypothetical protein